VRAGAALALVALGVCGCASAPRSATLATAAGARTSSTTTHTPPPRKPRLDVIAPAAAGASWAVVARVGATPVAWLAQSGGVTLMRFDQRHVRLDLHAGSKDGGVLGWTYGDSIGPGEIHQVVAAFNGAFKLTYHDVGFLSGGHVAVALKRGLASVVTYTDGTTNIGTWGNGVPSARSTVFSVLQNQHLLVDRGLPAANIASCVLNCWGGTIRNLTVVARSGLGITADGRLVWAAGEQLSPGTLASALIAAGAVRAIELDINPFWVAGYLYPHHPSGPVPVGVVPGMHGIAGMLLAPYSRDFFTVVAR
jgi:hypothetical protein